MRHLMSTEEYIEKANAIHNNKFSYPETVYKGRSKDVHFVCPTHGPVSMPARGHLESVHGCPRCAGKVHTSALAIYRDKFKDKLEKLNITLEEVITTTGIARPSMKERTYITLVLKCEEHGTFKRTLSGVRRKLFTGCPSCHVRPAHREWSTEAFLLEAMEAHGDRYDYSKSAYHKYEQPITIICKEHGEFEQLAYTHTEGAGCTKCAQAERVASKKQNINLGVSA